MLENAGFFFLGVLACIVVNGLWNSYVYWRDWEKDRGKCG